jgi:hypothetical protein
MAYRIFKIGDVQIVEDETTANLSNEEVRTLLRSQYPEVVNATLRETAQGDESTLVEFLPRPERKG